MKKVFFTIALFFTAASTTIIAGENKGSILQIKKSISQNISVPQDLRTADYKQTVLVSVITKENGKLEVVDIQSSDKVLKKHVEDQIERIHLKGTILPGQIVNLKLNFKVI
jgi:hypothetical protein